MTTYGVGPRVKAEMLRLDDPGAVWGTPLVWGSPEDQTAQLQAALDFAATRVGANGSVYLAGEVRVSGEIRMPATQTVPMYGLGVEQAKIHQTADLGPGKYTLKGSGIKYDLRDFAIIGPGAAVDAGLSGKVPCEVGGFFTRGQGIAQNLAIHWFGDGVALINDHQEFHSCDLQSNGVALNLIDNPSGGLGDQLWDRCYFTGCSRASIGIADTATMANARLTQGHIGSPFGFWRYASGTMSAIGAAGNAELTNVAVPPWFPISFIDGMTIAGFGIPSGTTVVSHTGSGFNYTLELSAPANNVVRTVNFPKCLYAATGSVAQGTTLTNVNIPDIFATGSITFGITIDGVNIQAGTTVTSISGSAGNYTLGLSLPPTGNVVGVIFAPRGTVLKGVVLENHSIESCSNAAGHDEGRTWGSWGDITFDSPGESGTGGGGKKWPGRPSPMPNWNVGDVIDWHWRDNGWIPQYDAPNQPFIKANAINNMDSDWPLSVSAHKSIVIRTVAEGNPSSSPFVNRARAGKPGAPGLGNRFQQWRVCSEDVRKGALLENDGTDKVRESRNNLSSLICGVAAEAFVTGDVVMILVQGDTSATQVLNHSASAVINGNVRLKPDTAHQGCVVAATSMSEPFVGWSMETIQPGTAGRATITL